MSNLIMLLGYLVKSWKTYLQNVIPFALGSLIILIATIVGSAIALVLIMGSSIPGDFSDIYYGFQYELISAVQGADIMMLALAAAVFGITIIVNALLQAGLYGMAIQSTRKKPDLRTMFITIRKRWAHVLGALMIVALTYAVVAIPVVILYSLTMNDAAVYIPALLASVFFALVYPAAVSGKNSLEAVKSSVSIAIRYYLHILVVLLFFSVFSGMSSMIPIAGNLISVLVITPWSCITYTLIYQKHSKTRTR